MMRMNPRLRDGLVSFMIILALAIGAGCAITMFSIVDHLMLRPLAHVTEPERILHIDAIRDYPPFLALREQSKSMEVAAYWPQTLSLNRGPAARRASVEFVSHNYFQVLGAQPALGRWFTEDEENAARLSSVVVLSHALWRDEFDADPAIVGKPVWITNGEYIVAGVAPRGFTGALVNRVDLWIPISRNTAIGTFNIMQPGGDWLYSIGRLREGMTFEQVQAEGAGLLSSGALGVLEAFPLRPLAEVRTRNVSAADRTLVLWLSTAAAGVLLLACANVAGLPSIRPLLLD